MHLSYMRKKADISEVLHLVRLENASKKRISEYSLGMKQRFGMARAIIHRPKLLILDEPLNGLDHIAITEMRELMRKLTNEGMSSVQASIPALTNQDNFMAANSIVNTISSFTSLIGPVLGGVLYSAYGLNPVFDWKGNCCHSYRFHVYTAIGQCIIWCS